MSDSSQLTPYEQTAQTLLAISRADKTKKQRTTQKFNERTKPYAEEGSNVVYLFGKPSEEETFGLWAS